MSDVITTSPIQPQPGQTQLSLYDLSKHQLAQQLESWREPAFRTDQIWNWLYGRLVSQIDEMTDLSKKLRELADPEPQLTDFIKAVKTRQKFALNDVNGHRSCTLVNLAKIAVQTGRPLRFDSKTQRFIDDEKANAYIKQPMREPWKLEV